MTTKSKNIVILLIFLLLVLIGFLSIRNYFQPKAAGQKVTPVNIIIPHREVIGFLPYWLISQAQTDYSSYLTTLNYFALTIGSDGTLKQYTRPGETEPGYLALVSGKADAFLALAQAKNLKLSLTVFSGNDDDIYELLKDPQISAQNLVSEITPVMQQYGFTDLNLDIEQVKDASPAARLAFTQFVTTVKNQLDPQIIKTLSLDVTASSFVKDTHLTDPLTLAPLVDQIIIMAYDYHYIGSLVTGPVAPLDGAGTISEYDVKTAVTEALKIVPAKKIVLGVPLYGYGWESLSNQPRSAVMPGSGFVISNKKAEELLAGCATCSAQFDNTDQETHFSYLNQDTGTYSQIFYPDQTAVKAKISLAKQHDLGGLALWALGYEGNTILSPLASYHH